MRTVPFVPQRANAKKRSVKNNTPVMFEATCFIDNTGIRGVALHQLSIIGFDDVEQAAESLPALTTIRQPIPLMARRRQWVCSERSLMGYYMMSIRTGASSNQN